MSKSAARHSRKSPRDTRPSRPSARLTRSEKVSQSDSLRIQTNYSQKIEAKNPKQQFLLDSIEGNDIVIALGPAGTGKTFVSVKKAVQLFMDPYNGYKQIVLARSIIPTGKSMGYLPGDVKEKLIPWVMPMLSVIEDSIGKSHTEYLMGTDAISIQPLETIRGRSFENTLMLVDEAQNLDFEEIKAVTTRLGKGSKLILMGDAMQSDIKGSSPLMKFVDMCERSSIGVPVIQFSLDEIIRSDIVGRLVKMFHLNGAMRLPE